MGKPDETTVYQRLKYKTFALGPYLADNNDRHLNNWHLLIHIFLSCNSGLHNSAVGTEVKAIKQWDLNSPLFQRSQKDK